MIRKFGIIIFSLFLMTATAKLPSFADTGGAAPYYRVWRGYPSLPEADFLQKLPGFMEATRQWLIPHSGIAYLPAVPPANAPAGLPGELALVAYSSQADYARVMATPEGQAYKNLHWTLFEQPGNQTKVAGPVPYAGEVVPDTAYDVFNTFVDWQSGYSRFRLATMKAGTSPEQLVDLIGKMKDAYGPQGLDGEIFVLDSNGFVASWEHWQSQEQAKQAYVSAPSEEIKRLESGLLETVQTSDAVDFQGQANPGNLYNVRFTIR